MRQFGTVLILPLLFAGCAWKVGAAREATLVETYGDLAIQPEEEEAPAAEPSPAGPGSESVGELETETPRKLTLIECFRRALDSAETLKIQGERMLQAEALRGEAIGGVLPRVEAHARHTRDSDEIIFSGEAFTPQNRTEYWFTLTQTLLDGRLFPALDVAAETRRIESLRLRDVRERLLYDVAAAFYQILSLERDMEAISSSRARFEEHVRVLEVQRRVGEASDREVLLARAGLEEAKARLIQAEHDRDRGRSRLARLLGVRSVTQELDDTLEVAGSPGEVPRLVDGALRRRFDLQLARAEIDRAEARKNLTRADYLPKAELEFNHWTKLEGGFNELIDWTVAIRLDWKLFDGGSREARMAQAHSLRRERALQASHLEKDVREQVEDAALAFRSLDRSLQAFESRAAAARESERLVASEFKGGEATNLDVLVAEEVLEDAERNLARAGFARTLAALRIRLAAGDLAEILREKSR